MWIAVDTPEGFEPAFATIVRERVNALFVMNAAVNYRELRRIADFAIKRRLPSVCAWREYADAGGLLSYGSGYSEAWRHAAAYVKKILDGAKPSDLPFVQPTKFELVINLRTAGTLGLTIPQSIRGAVGGCDSVIERSGLAIALGSLPGPVLDPDSSTAASENADRLLRVGSGRRTARAQPLLYFLSGHSKVEIDRLAVDSRRAFGDCGGAAQGNPNVWLSGLLTRRHPNVAAVALANKNARTIWALLAHEREFRPDYVPRPAIA